MKKRTIGVLVSGGLDSAVLVAEFSRTYQKVWPIYIQQGLAWESAEQYWLIKFLQNISTRSLRPLQVLSLPMDDVYGAHWSTGRRPVPGARTPDKAVYLPGRNLALTVKAAVFAAMHHIPVLALGSLGHNPFPDATPRFFRHWGDALGLGLGARLTLLAPYRSMTKAMVLQRGRQWPLHLSFSCIAPKGKLHCGNCNKCAERRRAFKAAKVEDQTHYVR